MTGTTLTQSDYAKRRGQGCRDCGAPRAVQATYCEPCRDARKRARKKASRPGSQSYQLRNHRKRARHYGVEYQVFDPRDVFERDG